VKALKYFKISCDGNHAPSCFNIGVMLSKGDSGVPKDEQAFLVYKKKTEELIKSYGGKLGGKTVA
jgi:TPR repeat protein